MTPIPCGAAHPESPVWHFYCNLFYCNLASGHSGPHYSAYSNTEWSNDDR